MNRRTSAIPEFRSKRKPTPTVDCLSYQAVRASTAFLQFQGRSSASLEAR